MVTIYKVRLACMRLSFSPFATFGGNVATKMTGNPHFLTPVVDPADLAAACTLLNTRIQDALTGGPLERTLRNDQYEVVAAMLRQLAAYVQSLAGDDLAKLLSSGFEAASTNRASVPLPQPQIVRVTNPASTALAVIVTALLNARAYEVRYSFAGGAFVSGGTFTKSRPILLLNLTPGVVYTIQVRGIGGSLGYSDWSDPISHMSM